MLVELQVLSLLPGLGIWMTYIWVWYQVLSRMVQPSDLFSWCHSLQHARIVSELFVPLFSTRCTSCRDFARCMLNTYKQSL